MLYVVQAVLPFDAKWSPIVVIDVIPAYFLNSNADTVIITVISDPGIFLTELYDIAITTTLTTPIAAFLPNDAIMVLMFWIYVQSIY